MKIPFAIAIALALSSPLAAVETEWQEVFPGVQMRLVAANVVTETDTTWIALEIDMPGDTKTYWRVPGESGIPPRFDFSQSFGVADYAVAWPMPMREADKGYVDHVYYGHTVLPLELSLQADHVTLLVDVMLGICSDICVPVAAQFDTMLDFAEPDRAAILRIRQARADVPIAWDRAESPFGFAVFDSVARQVSVELEDHGLLSGTVLADIAGSMALLGQPEHDVGANALVFPLLGSKNTVLEEGMALHLTFDTPEGPFEIVRSLRVAPQ